MAQGKKDGICLETASVSSDAGAGGMATQAKEEEKGTKIAAVAGSGRGCDSENQERYDFGPVEGPESTIC
jgi:hypothetical protein